MHTRTYFVPCEQGEVSLKAEPKPSALKHVSYNDSRLLLSLRARRMPQSLAGKANQEKNPFLFSYWNR